MLDELSAEILASFFKGRQQQQQQQQQQQSKM
jgi:hypothetical protein